jgi:hypothetical protein
MNSDIIDSLDDDDHFEGADFGDNEPDDENDYGVNKYTTLGRLEKLRHQEMEETVRLCNLTYGPRPVRWHLT